MLPPLTHDSHPKTLSFRLRKALTINRAKRGIPAFMYSERRRIPHSARFTVNARRERNDDANLLPALQ
jgi:hypothetical protein